MTTRKLTTEEFIKRSKNKFKDRYTYANTEYKNKRTKVIITCRVHGDFSILPHNFLYSKHGCIRCSRKSDARSKGILGGSKKRSDRGSYRILDRKVKRYNDYFIKKAIETHKGKYIYKFETYPINNIEKQKFIITCPIHGEFTQRIKNHLQGQGCSECGKTTAASNKKVTFEKFVELSNKKHNNFYIYNRDTYTQANTKTTITCPEHGDFEQLAISHYRGTGCPKCALSKLGSSPKCFEGKHTIFYILKLNKGLYKVGITTKDSPDTRYINRDDSIDKCVFEFSFIDGFDARTFEIEIIRKLKPFNYKGEPVMKNLKNTEIFTIDPTDVIQQEIVNFQVSRMFNGE